jgi:hypothetical protein
MGISLCVTAIVIFLISFLWLKNDLGVQVKKINDQSLILARAETANERLPMAREQSKKAEKYSQAMKNLLTTQDQLFNVRHWIENQARLAQVQQNFSFQNEESSSNPDELGNASFTLTLIGGIENIASILETIEINAPQYLLTLTSLAVTTQSNGQQQAIIQGKIYFKSDTQ